MDLQYKIAHESSMQKVKAEEAKLYRAILGASKKDTTRSSLSLAKHFIKKSPCSSFVLIVENGKVRLQDYLQRK